MNTAMSAPRLPPTLDEVRALLARGRYERAEIARLLETRDADALDAIRAAAEAVLLRECGRKVYYRGLVEFSNQCALDCHYCGIRRGNPGVRRYRLDHATILDAARWCAERGYGSLVLQSGERRDPDFVAFVEQVVRDIRRATVGPRLPRGLGITLCVGEQDEDAYRRFYAAGAHRYLLRIETSDPGLFARLHPPAQRFETRVACLATLRRIGFQVGTGVMIGLPGQTVTQLADDVLFFRAHDIDMIGMGPYIVHADTPMATWPDAPRDAADSLRLGLLMVGVTRLALRDVNIAATTALQALDPAGREQALRFGANIIMPQLTPTAVRREYRLYEGKPCLDEDREDCLRCLRMRIHMAGREVAVDEWGDSPHARRRTAAAQPTVGTKNGANT